MTKILRNHIIHEFAGVCYENPDLYHERHDKRSRWASCGPCRGRRPKALGARHFVIKSKSFKGSHIQLLTVNVTPLSRLERQPGCFKVHWRRVEVLELNHKAVQLCQKYHLI